VFRLLTGLPFSSNRELWGQGLVNIMVPMLNGFPHTGRESQSGHTPRLSRLLPLPMHDARHYLTARHPSRYRNAWITCIAGGGGMWSLSIWGVGPLALRIVYAMPTVIRPVTGTAIAWHLSAPSFWCPCSNGHEHQAGCGQSAGWAIQGYFQACSGIQHAALSGTGTAAFPHERVAILYSGAASVLFWAGVCYSARGMGGGGGEGSG
jgi:hypothetical protein